MAPTDKTVRDNKFTGKEGNWKKTKNDAHGVKKKRKWIPEHKMYEGSVKEGQGFAFKRKQRVKHEYNKLLRKEKRRNTEFQPLYQEDYPEHLRHLYMAEAEKLKHEAWTNRVNRTKLRMKGREQRETEREESAAPQTETTDSGPELTVGSELTDSVSGNPEPTTAPEKESLPISNRVRKKMLKKTSYQKTKEEFEKIKEKRKEKKEEYLKNKQQREEAIQRYKQKKMETYQMLSKKTKKGQPNLNLQMEYLLQKIQKTDK